MKEIFKPVPDFDGLSINQDGTVIYYKEKIKKIYISKNNDNRYKIIHIGRRRLSVARLVYKAFIHNLPDHKPVKFADKNSLNTNYKNLLPRTRSQVQKGALYKARGFDEVYVNNNGTLVFQYDCELPIYAKDNNNMTYFTVTIMSVDGSFNIPVYRLVYAALIGGIRKRAIYHKDGDPSNNHFTNLIALNKHEAAKSPYTNLPIKSGGIPTKIPQKDTEKVKKMLLDGYTLRDIATLYDCTDMSVVRFKKNHFTQEEIDKMNKAKGINTRSIDIETTYLIIQKLKAGKLLQVEIAKEFGVTPHQVCRINKNYIKNKKP